MTKAIRVFGLIVPGAMTMGIAISQTTTPPTTTHTVTAPPPALPIVNSRKLEVEFVEAHDAGGLPAQLQRHPGPFILVIANRSKDPAAWYVVDPTPATTNPIAVVSSADGPVTTVVSHLLTIGSGRFEAKGRRKNNFTD